MIRDPGASSSYTERTLSDTPYGVSRSILRSHTADFHFITMHIARTYRLWSGLHAAWLLCGMPIVRSFRRHFVICERAASGRSISLVDLGIPS